MFRLVARRFKGYVPFSWPVPRQLREVVKISAMEREDGLTIKYLWAEQFKDNPRVCTNSSFESEFNDINARMRRSPMFLCPLFMDNGGILNLVVQCQDAKHIMLTSLEEFKGNQLNAPPYAIITLFDDLVTSKGLALWRIDGISIELTREQLSYLLMFIKAFYSDPNLYQWVERFNNAPTTFSYDAFLSANNVIFQELRTKSSSKVDGGADPRDVRADKDLPLRMHEKPREEFKDWF